MSTRCVGRLASGGRSAAALPLKSPSTSRRIGSSVVARTAAAAETEVELQTSWHRSLPGFTPQTSRRRVIRRFAVRAADCGADGRSP